MFEFTAFVAQKKEGFDFNNSQIPFSKSVLQTYANVLLVKAKRDYPDIAVFTCSILH